MVCTVWLFPEKFAGVRLWELRDPYQVDDKLPESPFGIAHRAARRAHCTVESKNHDLRYFIQSPYFKDEETQ